MKTIISLAGDIGAGKGTIGKLLIDSTEYRFVSTGNILREIANRLNMNIVELNEYAETHKEVDEEADSRLIKFEKTGNNLIIDSRLAWHFIPSSFKIFLSASFETAAKRIYNDKNRKAEKVQSLDSQLNLIKKRRKLEIQRFHSLYGVECNDYKNYDLIIQTDHVSPEIIADIIFKNYNKWIQGKNYQKAYLSPKTILPIEHVKKLVRDDAKKINKSIKENGYNESEPIEIVKKEDFYYLWDGHKRCSAAIFNKIPLIPAVLLASKSSELLRDDLTVERFISSAYNKSFVYDWEEYHEFIFEKYP